MKIPIRTRVGLFIIALAGVVWIKSFVASHYFKTQIDAVVGAGPDSPQLDRVLPGRPANLFWCKTRVAAIEMDDEMDHKKVKVFQEGRKWWVEAAEMGPRRRCLVSFMAMEQWLADFCEIKVRSLSDHEDHEALTRMEQFMGKQMPNMPLMRIHVKFIDGHQGVWQQLSLVQWQWQNQKLISDEWGEAHIGLFKIISESVRECSQ